MRITPIEIRQKTFEKKAFGGYDKDEVTAFLEALSQEWERVNSEMRENKLKLEMAEREVEKLREVESSLYKTLKTAEDTGSNIVEQARSSAELRVKEAQMNAERILNEARNQGRNILQNSEVKSKMLMQEAINELKNLERDYKTLENHKDNMVVEIRNMVNSTLEKLNRLETKTAREEFITKIRDAQNFIEDASITKNNDIPKEIISENNKETIKENIVASEVTPKKESSFFDQI
jgi:cell division initiation protein